jgi:hypothetical protein
MCAPRVTRHTSHALSNVLVTLCSGTDEPHTGSGRDFRHAGIWTSVYVATVALATVATCPDMSCQQRFLCNPGVRYETPAQKFTGINSGGYECLRIFSHIFQSHPEMIRMEDEVLMINRLCIHTHTTKTVRSFHLFLLRSHEKCRKKFRLQISLLTPRIWIWLLMLCWPCISV